MYELLRRNEEDMEYVYMCVRESPLWENSQYLHITGGEQLTYKAVQHWTGCDHRSLGPRKPTLRPETSKSIWARKCVMISVLAHWPDFYVLYMFMPQNQWICASKMSDVTSGPQIPKPFLAQSNNTSSIMYNVADFGLLLVRTWFLNSVQTFAVCEFASEKSPLNGNEAWINCKCMYLMACLNKH